MIERETKFFELSLKVAQEFLQSTVIIDDFAGFTGYDQHMSRDRALTEPQPQRRPQTRNPRTPGHDPAETDADSEQEETSDPGETQYLNARMVIDSFAERKIICTVLHPKREDIRSIRGVLKKLADAVDIVVIDWSLHNDDGDEALNILTDMISVGSDQSPGQFRLLAIYTGSPEVANISARIKGHLKDRRGLSVKEDGTLALTTGATRIVVLAKPGTSVPDVYAGNVVAFDKLVDRLTVEFTAMTAGLVSNVVVAALSEARKNTHRVLSRFCRDLDAPYLSHRFMLPTPRDAEGHITTLVAEELQGILEEAKVGHTAAGLEAIRAWLNSKDLGDFETLFCGLSSEDVLAVLKSGLIHLDKVSGSQRNKIHKEPLTRLFQTTSDGAESLDERFAHLTITRAHYANAVPSLTLGTVLKGELDQTTSYLVCIQPRCDCVGVDSSRRFLFLPLSPPTDQNRPFDTVVLDGKEYVRLKCDFKPYRLETIPFEAGDKDRGLVTAEQQSEGYFFNDIDGKSYKWLGELRSDHALRLSDELSATMGRVGLDESEWLRRWARN